jgi:hypothetical protein
MGIIRLKKSGKEIQPLALYEKIVFDFGTKRGARVKEASSLSVC